MLPCWSVRVVCLDGSRFANTITSLTLVESGTCDATWAWIAVNDSSFLSISKKLLSPPSRVSTKISQRVPPKSNVKSTVNLNNGVSTHLHPAPHKRHQTPHWSHQISKAKIWKIDVIKKRDGCLTNVPCLP